MGNASTNPVRNLDKRTARREYREDFVAGIKLFNKARLPQPPPVEIPPLRSRARSADGTPLPTPPPLWKDEELCGQIPPYISEDWCDGAMKVFVRKRPLFAPERRLEFDVLGCYYPQYSLPPLSTTGKSSSETATRPTRLSAPDTKEAQQVNSNPGGTIVVHDARMHADMKKQLLHHHIFDGFDGIFDDKTSSEAVYLHAAKPLVGIALQGGYATALVYGQTGSGKTYTMSSIYEYAARDIFEQIDATTDRFSTEFPSVSLTFIEICGDQVHDLLGASAVVSLCSSAAGGSLPHPVVEPRIENAEQLLALIRHGLSVRATAATGVHDLSSRSHAVLTIYIQRPGPSGRFGELDCTEGSLTLVDLAGSETKIDSMHHGKERRKETSYINASLMALKDCLRLRAEANSVAREEGNDSVGNGGVPIAGGHIYRKSKLTLALKASLSFPTARTVVIACVSPASKDTEHSLNTLRHACIMSGQEITAHSSGSSHLTGGSVFVEEIGVIEVSQIARRQREQKKLTGDIADLKTSNGNTIDSSLAKQANKEVELTDKMKSKMRRAAEIRSLQGLSSDIKQLILYARQNHRGDHNQMTRLRRPMPGAPAMPITLPPPVDEQTVDEDYGDITEDEGLVDGMPPDDELADGLLAIDEEEEYPDDTEAEMPNVQEFQYPSDPPSAINGGNQTQKIRESITPGTLNYSNLAEVIFCVRDSGVPIEVLMRQLRTLLTTVGFSNEEVNHYMRAEYSRHFELNFADPTADAPKVAAVRKQLPTRTNSTSQLPSSSDADSNTTTSSGQTTQLVTRKPVVTSAVRSVSRKSTNEASSAPPIRTMTVISTAPDPPAKFANYRGMNPIGSSQRPSSQGRASQRPSSGGIITDPPANSSVTRESSSASESTAARTAREKIELEARQRRARQEAAKQYREEQNRLKSNRPKTPQRRSSSGVSNTPPPSQISPRANIDPNDFEGLSSEIERVAAILEHDKNVDSSSSEKLTSAQTYALKKQLALHKASALKIQRKKSNSSRTVDPTSHDETPVGGGNEGIDDSNPFVKRKPVDVRRRYFNNDPPTAEKVDPKTSDGENLDFVVTSHGRPIANSLASRAMQRHGGLEMATDTVEPPEPEPIPDWCDPSEQFKTVSQSAYTSQRSIAPNRQQTSFSRIAEHYTSSGNYDPYSNNTNNNDAYYGGGNYY